MGAQPLREALLSKVDPGAILIDFHVGLRVADSFERMLEVVMLHCDQSEDFAECFVENFPNLGDMVEVVVVEAQGGVQLLPRASDALKRFVQDLIPEEMCDA